MPSEELFDHLRSWLIWSKRCVAAIVALLDQDPPDYDKAGEILDLLREGQPEGTRMGAPPVPKDGLEPPTPDPLINTPRPLRSDADDLAREIAELEKRLAKRKPA
jgi:hypothetical protein